MKGIVRDLASVIRPAMLAMTPPAGTGRPSTKSICESLTKARPVIEAWKGGPIIRRYSGCPEGPTQSYRKSGGREFKPLEYLWDFSLSRYAIPQAIEDPKATQIGKGKFELLFVAESELGNPNEVCRDLLKLLEARTKVRCLVYRRPRTTKCRDSLEARMIRVLHNHAYFAASPGAWLFVGLAWGPRRLECDIFTLNVNLDALIPVRTA